jgi:signal transduction histidine kinase
VWKKAKKSMDIQFYNPLIATITDEVNRFQGIESERIKNEAVAMLTTQVAHDIRSPLEVLKGLKDEMSYFPDSTKKRIQLSINRIEEIAYNLLNTYKEASNKNPVLMSEDLLSILLSTITEKNIEYRKHEKLKIRDNLVSNSLGNFSKINRPTFKSILSNLINNSVESTIGQNGLVLISLDFDLTFNRIIISDNGLGISPDIKSKLFTKGFTTKKTGNGLGLYNAKQDIEAAGGTIVCESEVGKGTTFIISLPKSEAPATFIGTIDAYKYEKIIVLDDDPAFHEVWAKRLEGLE